MTIAVDLGCKATKQQTTKIFEDLSIDGGHVYVFGSSFPRHQNNEIHLSQFQWERCGSVVECLTGD